ncbi:MAG: hypothetical protein WKG06_05025 [Segetibacter sp.]
MKIKLIYLPFILIIAFLLLVNAACNKPPYIVDFKIALGYVIGKEFCSTNEAKDCWLVDLTYLQNAPQYGDTLVLNGLRYTNVIKTKDLAERLKKIGMQVSMDFKVISANKMETTGCTIVNPVTYNLKELFVINQFEIR